MELKHLGESLKSLDRGSRTIDHILVHGMGVSDIKQTKHLPFGLGFYTDHRGKFVDLDGGSVLKIKLRNQKYKREGNSAPRTLNTGRSIFRKSTKAWRRTMYMQGLANLGENARTGPLKTRTQKSTTNWMETQQRPCWQRRSGCQNVENVDGLQKLTSLFIRSGIIGCSSAKLSEFPHTRKRSIK